MSLRDELFSGGQAQGAAGGAGGDQWYGNSAPAQPTMQQQPGSMGTMGGPAGGDLSGGISTGCSIGSGFPGEEPPLLEELGINPEHIWNKTKSVLVPIKNVDQHILDDADIAGPVAFCLALGFCLLFSGKVHFGVIYGFFAIGCLAMYLVLNLMSQASSIDLTRVFSVLGYSLLPIVILSAFTILFNLRGVLGSVLAIVAVLWCAFTATRFFEAAYSMREQRYLIAYPTVLLYACFAMITVF